jgi:peptidoglycan-N-acetylglucosamine deacetylase
MDSDKWITIYIDGKPVNTGCIERNGCKMLPSLFFKHAGVKVDWNSERKLIILRTNNRTLKFKINCNYALYYSNKNNIWEKEVLPIIPIDTHIPLQYVVEKLGMSISYNDKTCRFYLITNISPATKPEIICKGDTDKKKVSLTFDDGPDNDATPKILDILHDNRVKATFCVVGRQVETFPEILERIAKEGHEICNHSWSHEELPRLTTCQVIKEIKKTEKIIQSITGIKTDFFRPPYGLVTDADLWLINDLGMKTIVWNVETYDYLGISEDKIIKIVNRDVSPGSIILQHSLQWKHGVLNGTINALPNIINQLQSKGMEFVTVNSLINC